MTVQVLLVEDSAGDAVLIRQILAESSTPTVLHIARDGEQALEMLSDAEFEPALIILDLNIPKIHGLVVLSRNPRKNIPVVVFTASINQADAKRAIDLGASEYIVKPMHLQGYREAITGMIEKWSLRKVAPPKVTAPSERPETLC